MKKIALQLSKFIAASSFGCVVVAYMGILLGVFLKAVLWVIGV